MNYIIHRNIIIICIAVLMSNVLYIFDENLAFGADNKCGPYCLKAVTEYYNIDVALEYLCNISNYDKQTGTTMLGLFNATKTINLPATALKTNWPG